MVPKLTAGAIQRIMNGEEVPKAVMQLLGYKKVPGAGSGDRYRLLLSDSSQFTPFAMLGTQLNHMVTNNELEKFTVIQIDKCVCNPVSSEKKVIIVLSVTVLVPGAEVGEKIGNPQNASGVPSDAMNVPTGAQTDSSRGAVINSSNNAIRDTYGSSGTCRSEATDSRNTSYGSNFANRYSDQSVSVHPINSLTPYQNKWTIKARVTSKAPIKHWSNSRGEGKLFSVNLLDESGEIRATGFNDAVDKFYDLMEINKVFYISKATLKTANKTYSSLKNDYEMTFNNDTTVTPCEDNTSSIPMLQFDFVPISQIQQVDKDAMIDVIGVCRNASDVQTIVTRTTNKELEKREVSLVDTTNTEVTLTLWGEEAKKFDPSNNPVIAVKGARVSDFSGRSLSMLMSSSLQINPDIKEAHVLKGWYDREGCRSESHSITMKGAVGGMGMPTSFKTFAQVGSENLGMADKPDYFSAKATVVLVRKENCMYMACPSEECNKKVVDMNNGLYRCEKCNKEFPNFKWRLLLSISLADYTENVWVTCFQEAAEIILGVSSQELGGLKESDEEKFNEVISDANFKSYIFKLRTKMETFNEESRLKTIVASAIPVDPLAYGKKLLSDIKSLESSL